MLELDNDVEQDVISNSQSVSRRTQGEKSIWGKSKKTMAAPLASSTCSQGSCISCTSGNVFSAKTLKLSLSELS